MLIPSCLKVLARFTDVKKLLVVVFQPFCKVQLAAKQHVHLMIFLPAVNHLSPNKESYVAYT